MRPLTISIPFLLVMGVVLLCSAFTVGATEGEKLHALYDKDQHLQYYVKGNAVYDKDWQLRYHVREGILYDKDWQRQYTIKGAEIYDKYQFLQYRMKEYTPRD